jgi:Kef-type K+ transport system membrane component KefB
MKITGFGCDLMPQISFVNLLIVAAVAVLAPLLLGYLPRLRLPAVVVEIVAGVVLGPSVLGWVHIDLPVKILAILGLAFLLFLAGLEIDLRTLRGRALRLALLGYGLTLVLGIAVGAGLGAAGWTRSPVLIAIALSATSLGLVVPVLKDAGKAEGYIGQTIIASPTVADFAAIVLLTLFFSTSGRGAGSTLVLLAIFAGLVGIVCLLLTQVGRSMRLGTVLVRLQDTTAEIRVRMSVALLIGFVALAERFGLETILGAFLAGAVVSLLDRDSASHPHFRIKLEAIGYGFLVPVFFVASGVQLDLHGLFAEPSALLRVPVFLLALLLVRGLPALLYLPDLGRHAAIAAGLLQATSLPFLVTAATIGMQVGTISSVTGAALICAGLLSVVIFPAVALAGLREPTHPGASSMLASPSDASTHSEAM